MCTSPIRILNPSKWLAPDQGQQLYMYVPCGHCWQCREARRKEWRVRSYYECMSTIENGGYMLFDTLTYSDEYLPHLSDYIDVPEHLNFSCFSSRDIQLFLKRLRKRLSSFFNVKSNLRYFIVSEYGSENYTFRPHYHCFFFVKNKSLDPIVLSHAIAESWPAGRTDGVVYRGEAYVKQHCLFDTLDLATKRCVLYVSKYVAKDFQFMDKVRDRLYRLMLHFYTDFDWQMSPSQKKFYYKLVNFVSPFHRQSLDFGNYYIHSIGRNKILEDGFIKFNFNGVPSIYSLFPSLKRKLLYSSVRKDGDYFWVLNCTGYNYKYKHYMSSVDALNNLINNYNLNHNTHLSFSAFDAVFNHNRLQPYKVISHSDIVRQIQSQYNVFFANGFRNYCCHDRSFLHKSVLTRFDYGSKKHGFSRCNRFKNNYLISLEDFSINAIYIDEIESGLSTLYSWTHTLGNDKLAVARHKERLTKLYKSIKLC